MLPGMADDAGTRDQRLQLYDVPGDLNDYGQPSTTGTLIGTFWGSVRNLSGRDMISAQQANNVVTHKIELGWLGTAIPSTASNPNRLIRPTMYLIHVRTGKRYDVVFANNVDEANIKWELTCNEIVN